MYEFAPVSDKTPFADITRTTTLPPLPTPINLMMHSKAGVNLSTSMSATPVGDCGLLRLHVSWDGGILEMPTYP